MTSSGVKQHNTAMTVPMMPVFNNVIFFMYISVPCLMASAALGKHPHDEGNNRNACDADDDIERCDMAMLVLLFAHGWTP